MHYASIPGEDKYVFPDRRKYSVAGEAGEWNMFSQAVTSIQWSGRTWAWITPNNPWPCPLLTHWLYVAHTNTVLKLISIFNPQQLTRAMHTYTAQESRDNRFWIWDSNCLHYRTVWCVHISVEFAWYMFGHWMLHCTHQHQFVLNCCHRLRYSTRRTKRLSQAMHIAQDSSSSTSSLCSDTLKQLPIQIIKCSDTPENNYWSTSWLCSDTLKQLLIQKKYKNFNFSLSDY